MLDRADGPGMEPTRLAAGLSWNAVAHFERDGAVSACTVETIRRTLEKAGVIFIDANDGGPGAQLRKGRWRSGIRTPASFQPSSGMIC
jgi:hypothetical protein